LSKATIAGLSARLIAYVFLVTTDGKHVMKKAIRIPFLISSSLIREANNNSTVFLFERCPESGFGIFDTRSFANFE